MAIPGFIPGDKAAEWKDVLAAKKGVVGFVPGVAKEEVKKTPVKK